MIQPSPPVPQDGHHQVRLLHTVRLSLSLIRVGTRQRYWYVRYTDEGGVRQKVYLGKHLPSDGTLEACVRKRSPHLFPPPPVSLPVNEKNVPPLTSRKQSDIQEQQDSPMMIFRCCSCGGHPTDNPLFVICHACREQITAGSHYRKQSTFHHPKEHKDDVY